MSDNRLRTQSKVWFIAAGTLGLLGCGGPSASNDTAQRDSAVWTAQTAWTVTATPIVEILGSGQQVAGFPLDPVSVSRLRDGRYVVGDGDQNGWDAILVYTDSGKFLQQLGRSGEGPGEFGQLYIWAGEYRGDSIAAYDQVGGELQIFAKAGTFARTLKLRPGRIGRFYGVLASGNTIQGSTREIGSRSVNLHNPDAREIRELFKVPKWGRASSGPDDPPYFGPHPIYHVGRARFYHGMWDRFAIQVIDTLGRTVHVLQRSMNPEPLTEADREQITSVLVKAASGGIEGSTEIGRNYGELIRTKAEWPKFRPAFGTIIEDSDENVWVEHYRFFFPDFQSPQPKPTTWSIFDRTGRFLGEVTMPASFIVSSITTDQVLGFWVDEFDVEHVRVYRLIKR